MLKFNGAWRFDSPGRIADGVSAEFSRLIGKVASQVDSRQSILEHFKAYFASAAGTTSLLEFIEWYKTALSSDPVIQAAFIRKFDSLCV